MSAEFPIFLSHDTIKKLNAIDRSISQTVVISLDLGRSSRKIFFRENDFLKIGHNLIPIPADILASSDERTIWKYNGKSWEKWERFDEQSNRYYKMIFVRQGKPPTIEISGIKMHVTKAGDPSQDTHRKLESLRTIRGTVLDTSLGLGYTAIAASGYPKVERVYVCERDPVILEFCLENPWSIALFTTPRIQPILIPVQEFIGTVPDSYFNVIIHDPPRFALAPEVYAESFYRNLFRILKPGGELYHYTGDPNRRTRRHSLAEKTATLLSNTGFRHVRMVYAGVGAQR
ncbi:MAG: hypothetical protein EH225_11485 [Calditrichaeota bacterium]|nr:MAG: hypothetical protein EH225_11485 [Calditrichota bacterium]